MSIVKALAIESKVFPFFYKILGNKKYNYYSKIFICGIIRAMEEKIRK